MDRIDKVTNLNIWEGDKIFLERLEGDNPFFSIKYEYDKDRLVNYEVNEY